MKSKQLNPVIMIEDDYRALKRFAGTSYQNKVLARELERADIVHKDAFPKNDIRLYTQVSLVEKATKKRISFAIVLPGEADIKQQKISALAAVAVAEGEVEWMGARRVSKVNRS